MFSKIKTMSSYKKCMYPILVTGTPERLLGLGNQKIAAISSQIPSWTQLSLKLPFLEEFYFGA